MDKLGQVDIDRPIFVLGSPRSGTSLLRLILMSHSEVSIPPECGFALWWYKKYRQWSASDSLCDERRHEFIGDLMQSRKIETWGLENQTINAAVLEHVPRTYAELCALVYITYARQMGKVVRLWGDKNNFYINLLPQLDALYPQASYLHIVRDGRDVACSYREVMSSTMTSAYAPKLPAEIEDIADEWVANNALVEDFFSTLPDERKKSIRYEDLVGKTDSVLPPLFEWLGVKYEPEVEQFYRLNKEAVLEPAQTMEWKKRTLEPISADTVGRYRDFLSDEELKAFQGIAKTSLQNYGYL